MNDVCTHFKRPSSDSADKRIEEIVSRKLNNGYDVAAAIFIAPLEIKVRVAALVDHEKARAERNAADHNFRRRMFFIRDVSKYLSTSSFTSSQFRDASKKIASDAQKYSDFQNIIDSDHILNEAILKFLTEYSLCLGVGVSSALRSGVNCGCCFNLECKHRPNHHENQVRV